MLKSMNLIIILIPFLINMILIILLMKSSKILILPPMMFMIMLIMMTILISYKMNFLKNSWMSMILFLIMIGGLMVIYMYITSLINNEMFFINLKLILINLIKISPIFFIYMFINYKNIEMNLFNLNNSWLMNLNYNQPINNLIYKNNNNISTLFIMVYLFYSMICIMNICYKFKIPLRQMMFYV